MPRSRVAFLATVGLLVVGCATSPSTSGAPPSSSQPSTTAGAASSGPTQPAGLSLTGRISFTRDDQLVLMDADGSHLATVPDAVLADTPADWSADGAHLTFHRYLTSFTIDLYRIDADGSHIAQLTSLPDAEVGGYWSPDGTRIAFDYRQRDESSNVFTMNADGSQSHQITSGADFESWFNGWSPDGSRILVVTHEPGPREMWLMNPDGSGKTKVIADLGTFQDEQAQWSPDGTAILFVRTDYDHGIKSQLYTVRPDGTDLVQLTDFPNGVGNAQARWSPDSSRIVFIATDPGIHVMNRDGSGLVTIGDVLTQLTWPTWSPDGSLILCVRLGRADPATGFADGDLVVVRPDGTGLTELTTGPTNDQEPTWAPRP